MGLPSVARIRQRFRDEHIADVPGAVRAAISACHAVERVRPGSRVAITAGSRIVALDLTPESHANALGIVWADFTTRRLVDSIDQQAMFMNCVTANAPDLGKIHFALADDRAAIEVALKTAARDGESARLARVHSTLHLSELYVLESLVGEVKDNALLEVVAPPEPMQVDGKGRLRPPVLSVQ